MTPEPVWITGIGLCTPCGNDLPTVANHLLEGRSAIRSVAHFPTQDHPSQMAAAVTSLPEDIAGNRTERAVASCAEQSLRSAGLWDRRESMRIGIILGIGSEWLLRWEDDRDDVTAADFVPAVELARQRLGIRGPVVSLSAACASGNHAFALARAWLRQGVVDACIAGGCDMAVTPMTLAGFGNLRALSRRNDNPIGACRPFDRDRDGFILGEGCVFCVLERRSHVLRRGGPALAEVAGFGATSDAHHLVIPSPDPSSAAAAIRAAIRDAGISPDEINYINAHGTGTPVGDAVESAALRVVLGHAADRIPASSIKATSGHLLTAAAAFEAVAGILAMDRSAIPPTLNLDNPDPACQLDHVAHTAREARVDVVLSNSFGFGGSNTSLVLRRVA
ncbi:MAG: beta-ketoacyl-[acyl-carrier-protein] synthase family protein [Gemmataceae bacterium]|nr:beta-ketoacyl-[acyl-carrier-protein] synthase family protein [Gemmataceae bacterium]